MSDLKHAKGTTPENDEQTEARLATLAATIITNETSDNTVTDSVATGEVVTDTVDATTTGTTVDVAETDGQMPHWLLPDKAYQALKWITLTVLPALAVLVGALGPVWNIPNTEAIMTTISAVALFFGAVIGVSAAQAKTA